MNDKYIKIDILQNILKKYNVSNTLKEEIEQAAVIAQPVNYAKWNLHHIFDNGWLRESYYSCSNCGCRGNEWDKRCHNCGAIME
ncbi:MAG: hypothetical protein LIO71_03170 [Ruminococcus sp.]|nr:hypothetical protein [Ruminococcus sp.]